MEYVARFDVDGDGIIVTFPDVPEAITGGSDEAAARINAADALAAALLAYVQAGRKLPVPHIHEGVRYRPVPVSAALTAKLAFIAAFRDSGMTQVALAARLGKAENEVRRMLDPWHATKLASLEKALAALGKRLVVRVEPVA